MNRTKIEWTQFTWNPITGCTHGCPYCYARKITERFPANYPNAFKPTFYPARLREPGLEKKPAKIFTCSMGDLFDPLVNPKWQHEIFMVAQSCSKHIFQILTKQPQNIPKEPIPDNVWLGVSVTCNEDVWRMEELNKFGRNLHKGIRFVSFEPLLGEVDQIGDYMCGVDWVIIGAQTNPTVIPSQKSIQTITYHAKDTPIFFKNSMMPFVSDIMFRQDFPVS